MHNFNLFAIVCSRRCGTTMLGMMLGSHPHITHYNEDGLYPVAVYRRRRYDPKSRHLGLKLTTLTLKAARPA